MLVDPEPVRQATGFGVPESTVNQSCVVTPAGADLESVVEHLCPPDGTVQGFGDAVRVAVGTRMGDGSVLDCHAEPVHLYHWLYEFFVNIFPL